jgi:hypothetical protein
MFESIIKNVPIYFLSRITNRITEHKIQGVDLYNFLGGKPDDDDCLGSFKDYDEIVLFDDGSYALLYKNDFEEMLKFFNENEGLAFVNMDELTHFVLSVYERHLEEAEEIKSALNTYSKAKLPNQKKTSNSKKKN